MHNQNSPTNSSKARVFARQTAQVLTKENTQQVTGGTNNEDPQSKPNRPPQDGKKCWDTRMGGFFAIDCTP